MNASHTPEEAAKPFVFSSPEGYALCRRILKEYLSYESHDVQIEGICVLESSGNQHMVSTDMESFLQLFNLLGEG
jgi:hypothetical protein